MSDDSHQSDPHRRARLRWRARRGLLENDIVFERFFGRYEHDLTDADVGALSRLLDLSDNDLMDGVAVGTDGGVVSTGATDNIADKGSAGGPIGLWEAGDFINASMASGATSGLVGSYAIHVVDITA